MSFAANTPIQFVPGIGWRTAQVLHELEIHTVEQLKRVPEKMLVELFGPSIRSVLALLQNGYRKQNRTARTFSEPTMNTNSPRYMARAVAVDTIAISAAEDTGVTSEKRSFFKRLQLASQFIGML